MTEATEPAVPTCTCGMVKFRVEGAYVCRHCDRADCPYRLARRPQDCERCRGYEDGMKQKVDLWYVYK